MPKLPMADRPLTSRQKAVHKFMLSYQKKHGFPPTLRETAAAIGCWHQSSARCHMRSMVAKGAVRTHPRGQCGQLKYIAVAVKP
jgi:SOS-response transcriptional repressor LexA